MDDAKSRAYAYAKFAGDELFEFKSPLKLDVRGRKFREVNNRWNFKIAQDEPEGFVKIVIGSKGERYTITEVNNVQQCSCPGFKFRGKCRHIES